MFPAKKIAIESMKSFALVRWHKKVIGAIEKFPGIPFRHVQGFDSQALWSTDKGCRCKALNPTVRHHAAEQAESLRIVKLSARVRADESTVGEGFLETDCMCVHFIA